MASIQTAVELRDNFSTVVNTIIASTNMMISSMEEMNRSMNADVDTSGIESIREYMNQATIAANQLNDAIDDIDASAPARSQRNFNETIRQGTNDANDLVSTIKDAVAAYATMETVKGVLNASDELIQTKSRLDMMNDGLQSTQDLLNMTYVAAQDARGSFSDMADVVARFGNNAKDAFDSSAEVVQFANLIQKSMTIAGASTQEAAAAELQLSQALGSGVLRGDELNSIFEQAPNLIQNIADYLNVPIGKIREMAQEGQLSASIVKNAIFAATDQINANFESMPMTWGQVWTMFQNDALMAFEPVLSKINELANNEEFQNSLNSVMNGLSSFATFTLDVFETIVPILGFIADNWNSLVPIIGGVTAAVITYKAVHAGMGIISSIVGAVATAYGIEASQVTAATVAQYGLNTAMNACPLMLILSLIAAVVAGLIYVNNEFGSLKITIMVFQQIFMTMWENFLYCLTLVEVKVAEFVAKFKTGFYTMGQGIVSVLTWMKADALAIIQDMVNGAIDLVNTLINTVNKIPGVSFEGVQRVTFGTDAQIQAQAADAAAKANIENYAQQQQENVDIVKQWSDDYYAKIAAKQQKREAAIDKAMTEQAKLEQKSKNPSVDKYKNYKLPDNSLNPAIAKNTSDTAKNTAKTANAVAVTAEDLKYLRELAEVETVNRFTTAKITVNQTNHNTINKDMDLDGVTEHLRSTMEEQMLASAQGVY